MTFFLIYYFILFHRVSSELTHAFTTNLNGENETWKQSLELSPRDRIKDSSYLLGRYPIRELPSDSFNCHRHAKCVEIQKNTCMGTRLPYTTTTLELIPEHITQDIIEVLLLFIFYFIYIYKYFKFVRT